MASGTEKRWSHIPDYPDTEPRIDPKFVKKFVTAAHNDLQAVAEMLDAYPGLLNSSWDWGNGDFEQAIESAAQTGRRDIVEFLLSRGARPNILVATMMGWLPIVQTAMETNPGIKDVRGPHGFNLAHFARAGGEEAIGVARYLESLGVVEQKP